MKKRQDTPAKATKTSARDLILNAAEQVFSERGFAGTTVRDICQRAGVNIGLMSYYFDGKDALFTEVIERRLPEMLECFDERVQATIDRGSALSVQDAFYTYSFFLLELAADRNSGWGYYVRLLAQSSAIYDLTPVTDLLDRFKPFVHRFRWLLAQALPECSEEQISQAAFYVEAAITTVIVSGDLIHQRLPGVDASRPEAVAQDIAAFFANRMN